MDISNHMGYGEAETGNSDRYDKVMAKQPILTVAFIIFASFALADEDVCKTPQVLEIGKSGKIVCSFSEDFSSIHWYFNLDVKDGLPTISYSSNGVDGTGYTSGEFNIDPDGSLVINNVSVEHEAKFSVVEFETLQDLPREYEINIITFIRPEPTHPVIDDCAAFGDVCYIQWQHERPIVCRIQQARPGMALTWLVRTIGGDIAVNNETTYSSLANSWTSSLSVDDPFIYSSYLALLVCKADDQYNLLDLTESLVLVHNQEKESPSLETREVAVERNKKIRLPCDAEHHQLLVWEKITQTDNVITTDTTVLIDAVGDGQTSVVSDEYKLEEGNLIIDQVDIHHEGLYRCTYNDGTTEGTNTVNLVVYVIPIPGYPVVEGCTHKQYCVLDVGYTGSLTCSVRGIRPEVELEWRVYHEDSTKMISLHDQQLKTTSNDETFTVFLTTHFTTKETAEKKLTVECRVIGSNAKHFNLSSKIDLLFPGLIKPDPTGQTTAETIQPSTSIAVIIVVVVILIIVIVVIVAGILYTVFGGRQRSKLPQKDEERVPLVTRQDSLFLSQLKSIYENLYSAVKPIPFLHGNFTVHELYVEGGIEYKSKNKKKENPWEPLGSYNNIFTHPEMMGNRWIIEGEPGYGKSTLSLQLAYEWCNKVPGSFMSDIDIFLFIRLRQLKGVKSIYEAIKMFILPKNSSFTVNDIKDFIANSSSVLIILDGFDEYPDRDSKESSDVFDIINGKMLPECKVILTTRSLQRPKDYAPRTNVIKLTGFKTEAQDKYMQKAVTVNGHKSMENTIKEWLEANPILNDLCEVPLFFVMYAHLSLDSDALRNCTSVTSFFRYMITCLHSHLKLKFKDENVDMLLLSENFHEELDKICFDHLNGHSYNPDISKDILIPKLGKEFLEHYLSIGILREETSVVMSNEPGIQASDHVKTVSNVRFYHSLFCEWYAAHHLADALDKITPGKNDEEGKWQILEDLEPSHLHKVEYRCYHRQRAEPLFWRRRPTASPSRHQNTTEISDTTTQIAVSREITIKKFTLDECFKRVDLERNEIVLNTDVRLPPLIDVSQLWFHQKGFQLSEEILSDIFKYASSCRNLKEISFAYVLMPLKFKEKSAFMHLKSNGLNDIKVIWYSSINCYSLDLDSGAWQQTESLSKLTKEEYDKVVTVWNEL
ncbi:putative NLR family CARD domain-containing protein 4 [Apostichopus japonicus]|uniref:Putative NLR family CARD domain-containing protein 4 n=1 Tax=Stichopus japonicus TaxID=307972 RepID=A0A2G8JJZ3_STIJA|nr:putative NLR family CARD domain-containing protein 4 [Apostichopus japonicus]